MNDLDFRMIELAGQGFHCSQILLLLGLDAQGKTNPDLIRVMNSLAGGLGFTGDTCGALTGGACLIGLYAGRGEPEEEEDPRHNLMISDLVEWFTQEYSPAGGRVKCREIIGDDPNRQKTLCPRLVADTYERVVAILLENGYDLTEGRGKLEVGAVAYSDTMSLCPECLRVVPAIRYHVGPDVLLKKTCPDHGAFTAVIWRGDPSYASWARSKTPWSPPNPQTAVARGCPFDCGLCAEHRQQTCTALIEVTLKCDLGCRFCFAQAGPSGAEDPTVENIAYRLERVAAAGIDSNIQLSGGEPTLRDDLPQIVSIAREIGFKFVQLNTNGIRLGRDRSYTEELKAAGLASVFLQFDGVTETVHTRMRGRPLLAAKNAAIEACAENEIGVVLVPTVAPGINDHELGAIVNFGLDGLPTVRGTHFQPVSYFGRYPGQPWDKDRITIPEVIRSLEEQTDGLVKSDMFNPPGCENAYCSFNGNFVLMPDRELKSFSRPAESKSCCGATAAQGADLARKYVARQWTTPEPCRCKGQPDESFSLGAWDMVLERARTHTFSISGMVFQDVWTIQLDRLKDCCIHVVSADGRFIPFCAYNLTGLSGRELYSRG